MDELDKETISNLLHFYRNRYSQLEFEFLLYKTKAEQTIEQLRQSGGTAQTKPSSPVGRQDPQK
jgi:tellurite resistance protein